MAELAMLMQTKCKKIIAHQQYLHNLARVLILAKLGPP